MPFMKSGIIHKKIDNTMRNEILLLINNFAKKSKIDYHPESNNQIRDIVHPSLYPLIKNIKKSNIKTDFWKRPYE